MQNLLYSQIQFELHNVPGGAFEGVEDQVSPFGYGRGEGVDAGHGDPEWICSKEKPRYDQIFQSLNPIDGKVTGAGMNLHTLTHICSQPHLRGTITVNKALDAMLSSTQNCSLLTELCMELKDRKDEDNTLQKVTDALSVATQNTNMIAQFLVNQRVEEPSSRMSSSVSIHSLNDSYSDGARATTSIDYKVESSTPDPKVIHDSDEVDSESSSDEEANKMPDFNLNLDENNSTGFFEPIFDSIKFIFLLVLNVVTIMITTQVMFITLAYIFTGEIYLEFAVDKSPQSWLEKAKAFAFGSTEETIRIHSIFEIFHRQNVVNILKYFTQNISNSTFIH